MGGQKLGIEYPDYYENQNVQPNINLLSQVGRGLLGGGFMNPNDPQLGWLNQLVALNPEMTRRSVDLATQGLTRSRDVAQNSILQQLEANNQLTSSVTGNSLADLNRSYSQDIGNINTQFYLADEQRAMNNIYNLFGLGTGVTSDATRLGLEEQSQHNAYNQQQAGYALGIQQANARGGWGGAIAGGLGGAATGFMVGGPWGAAVGAGLGATGGYFGSPSTGGSIMGGGLGAASFRGTPIGGQSSWNPQWTFAGQPSGFGAGFGRSNWWGQN